MLPGFDSLPLRREFFKLMERAGFLSSDFLHRVGDETKSGVLMFEDSPIVPTATLSGAAINKGQADKAYSILGASNNLIIKNNTAIPNSQLNIDADEIILKDSSGNAYLASAVNLTIDITVIGENGRDAGSEANSTWYYVWIIYNPTTDTVAGILSTSATAPTFPSGYTYGAQKGAIYNDVSGNLVGIYQDGDQVWCDSTLISSTLPTTSYNAVLLGTGNVPPTARKVVLSAFYYAPASSLTRVFHGPKNSALGVSPIFQTGSGAASGNAATGMEFPILTPNTVYNRVSNANLSIYELYLNGWKY